MKHFCLRIFIFCSVCFMLGSCKVWNSVFGPKYGCKSNGKNVGAERIMSGEKMPRAKKFKS